jgi:hypothetical protein
VREAQVYDDMAEELEVGSIKPGEKGTEPLY